MPTPLQRFENDLQQVNFHADPAQARAIKHIQALYNELMPPVTNRGLLQRLLPKQRQSKPPKGLYLWGGVGRGKTYLMDLLFDSLPIEQKLRTHFHRFMRDIHRQLDLHKGTKNPLTSIASEYAAKYKIICFDEFFVTDITDAMILANLLQAFIDRNIVFVTTSNIEPAQLYKNGLQRQRFLPAITIIEENTHIINIDNGTDYRLRKLTQANLYHTPLTKRTHQSLLDAFHALSPQKLTVDLTAQTPTPESATTLTVNHRVFSCLQRNDDIIWFDFSELCVKPNSQNDYLELASIYHTMIISDVPQLSGDRDDAARRFINLIDVCYDASVKLILSAEVPIIYLYTGKNLSFAFQRTISRLQEMQSKEYLALPHHP